MTEGKIVYIIPFMAKEIPPEKLPTKEEALQGLENPMIKVLEDHGITLDYLSEKLSQELKATEQRVFNAQGIVIYSDKMVTWKTRQEARKDAHKLRGDYPAEKRDDKLTVSLEEVIKELEGEEDQ